MYDRLLFCGLVLIVWGFFSCAYEHEVDFNSQVRPILNKNCMSCRGGVRQNGGLSFLFQEMALDTLDSGKFAIVPGSARKSALIHRIKETDPELRMPPEGPGLTEQEIKTLAKWIDQGAKWADHWAYTPPDREINPPSVQAPQAVNQIDQFIAERLDREGLQFSEEADQSILIRRLSLDLIGLPPSQELAEQFINDSSEDAYEQLVGHLLESAHYGEKWASFWLDLARYADSQGYQKDKLRPTMWMYRDWVINAFNHDMPFDQFTIEQLAGDILPDHGDDQLLATAFHRNTMNNDEGGTDDEEFRVAAVLDRVNTTFEIWQGTTIGCVQCHTHPYDPIRHQEFYRAYAIFNNTKDADKASDEPNTLLLSAPQMDLRKTYQDRIRKMKTERDTLSKEYRKTLKGYLSVKPQKVPVMQELPPDSARKSHVFVRGNWLVHGEEVTPGVPDALNKYTSQSPGDRLELAQWLVDSENPLTSRVIVNRIWEQLFGQGLVETLEDFGTQGSPPTHPQLLDWLAVQFMDVHQWRIKPLINQIVRSATYRQSSNISPELLKIDPYNKLLARGPRVRLSAEQIRDQALFVSGLMNPRIYGPSVMPPQPEGVWNVIRHIGRWETETEPVNQHRRALYTFWRRVSPYPSMLTFDATSREFCVSRRIRTNTPLQAFVTLNDPVFVEATKKLAVNMSNSSNELDEQIKYGFNRTLYRMPTREELSSMHEVFEKSVDIYRGQPQEALALTSDLASQTPEMAALVNLAAVILNLDEMITKG